jgi:cytochrome c oxidase subunit 4
MIMRGLREPIVIAILSLALVAGAVLTATVPLGIPHNVAVVFGAVAAAATLVWSMELRHEPPLVRLLVTLGFALAGILIGFTIFDGLTR